MFWSDLKKVGFGVLLLGHALAAAEIHEAAKMGKPEVLRAILAKDRSQLNARDHLGYTPLHWALIRAQWAAADFLLDQGADVRILGDDGGTMLHCAANHDAPAMIERLVAGGVDPNVKNIWGNTPLALTVQRGRCRTIWALVAQGADLQAATAEGWTPLHLAYRSGQEQARDVLIELGADPNARDHKGRRPIELLFRRPPERPISPSRYGEYAGEYEMSDGFRVRVFGRGDKLMLEDYAQDEIYPIAQDAFYDSLEPWRIRFYRDAGGRVDKILLDFQTVTVIGRRVSPDRPPPPRVRLGLAVQRLGAGDVEADDLRSLFFEGQANVHAPRVARVGEGSAAEKAGIRPGDVLLELANESLREPEDLPRLLLDLTPGERVPVKLWREKRIQYLWVTLEPAVEIK